MKHHSPNQLKQGTCFVCQEPCKEDAYAHFECAVSMSIAKEIENQKAKVLNLLEVIKEKDKMLGIKPSKKPL